MESLGLDIKLLIAQIVNFGLLFLILRAVLYKPLLKIIDERNKKINDAVENSQKLSERLAKIEEKEKEIFANARAKASREREELLKIANTERGKIIEEAKLAAEREVAKGAGKIEAMKDEAAKEISEKVMSDMLTELEKRLTSKAASENYPGLRDLLK